MSDDSMKKRPRRQAPHTVDSTNSSVLENDLITFDSPENGSLIMNNGSSNKFLAQTLRSYIDALKFDPSAQSEQPSVKKNSSLVVAELLGHNKNAKGPGKRAQGQGNAKSKVTFSSTKSSAAYLSQNALASSSKSQQQTSSRETGKREKSKSSTNTVIREWGKRPMLVESEAPWTLRNRMYQTALKNVARAKQLTEKALVANNNNNLPYLPQSINLGSSAPQGLAMQYAANNGNVPVIVQTNNGPQMLSFGQVPVGGQQQPPIVTGMMDINNRPVGVTRESPQNTYAYAQPGMVLTPQQQQPQSVVYGQLNSQEREIPQEKPYMDKLMEATNTYIQWPSRMKIGAKTKKDLYVRVYGHNPDDVNEAKAQILADFGPHRDLRITLKMEISYTDHSHLIGCRGATIRRVMEDTGCHIHFPDSNRMSKDHKSNQVTIAGSSVQTVEQARSRVRELSPLLFQFTLPMVNTTFDGNPDAHHVFIENIQSNYNVQVTIHPPNKLQQTSVTVKGCEIDATKIKEAISKIVRYFSGGAMVNNMNVESTMEISAAQHSFVRAVNDSNIHSIMMNTGAKIIFPDLSDTNIQQIKRSRVYVSGDINCVYNARQQLIGCLPLRMIFDLADDFPLDWEAVRMIGSELNVNVKLINRNRGSGDRGGPGSASLPPPIPGRGRTIQLLIAAERNTANIYEARRRILGTMEPPAAVSIPGTYALRPTVPPGNMYHYGNRLAPAPPGPLPPLMLPPSPNMLSPVLSQSFWPPTPTHYGSPFCSPPIATCVVNNGSGGNNNGMSNGDPPPGLSKQHHHHGSYGHHASQGNHGFVFNSNLSTPVGPTPEFSLATMNAMKQSMHLPLMDAHSIKSFPTPASSTVSETSGSSHPMNNLMQEFRDFDLKRKAPGWERSNTQPNLFGRIPSTSSTSNASDHGSISGESADTSVMSTRSMQDKKYMAVKAMYNTKIGPNPRVPNAEWAGCGFSRTHLSLFPQDADNTGLARSETAEPKPQASTEEKSSSSTSAVWAESEPPASTSNDGKTGGGNNVNGSSSGKPKDCGSGIHPKPPLVPQQSNLLDFAASRTTFDRKPTDLPSLFIENGLEKYIQIDLEAFASLTEADLRVLGVSSYPARKRMHLLIASLNCTQADSRDNWD